MSDAIVAVRDLVKNFASGKEELRILKGLSFDIARGSSVAISGESGSGKSTLLNIIGGLDRSTSGTVKVGDWQLDSLEEKALTEYRSRFVGFIFQFHYLLKDFTALENVMLPGYIGGMTRKKATERARELLDDVKLSERAHHYPSQLSGGERQRVAVARAMINSPELILADEPTGNLDPDNSVMVAELLYATAERYGKSLVVVTHDERVAARAASRLTLEAGVLKDGVEAR